MGCIHPANLHGKPRPFDFTLYKVRIVGNIFHQQDFQFFRHNNLFRKSIIRITPIG